MTKKYSMTIKRGDIFVVNFDPTMGSEVKKTRPALILQNDIANKYSPVTIVAAITTYDEDDYKEIYPTEVFARAKESGLKSSSLVLLNQIRTIDKKRLFKKIGGLDSDKMIEINKALKISLGMTRL